MYEGPNHGRELRSVERRLSNLEILHAAGIGFLVVLAIDYATAPSGASLASRMLGAIEPGPRLRLLGP